MLGRIKLFLRCIDYSLSMLIIVCCLVLGSWWFSAENYSYEEGLYPREEYCQDICKIYSDIAFLSQKRHDWPTAINAYQEALQTVLKTQHDMHDEHARKKLSMLLDPIYEHLAFCHKQLDDKKN